MIVNTVKDGSGSNYWWLGDSAGRGQVVDQGWQISLQSDENLNDSDKEFAVPASTEWEIDSIWVELTTTATVGNRQMCIDFRDDADDVIGQIRAGAVQAANLTYYYFFSAHVVDLTVVRDSDYLSTPMPRIGLAAGYDIRVWDKAAVDAGADDMIVQMIVRSRTPL